jgi:hypothetical protein
MLAGTARPLAAPVGGRRRDASTSRSSEIWTGQAGARAGSSRNPRGPLQEGTRALRPNCASPSATLATSKQPLAVDTSTENHKDARTSQLAEFDPSCADLQGFHSLVALALMRWLGLAVALFVRVVLLVLVVLIVLSVLLVVRVGLLLAACMLAQLRRPFL